MNFHQQETEWECYLADKFLSLPPSNKRFRGTAFGTDGSKTDTWLHDWFSFPASPLYFPHPPSPGVAHPTPPSSIRHDHISFASSPVLMWFRHWKPQINCSSQGMERKRCRCPKPHLLCQEQKETREPVSILKQKSPAWQLFSPL